jgi:hypothetical protein
MALILASGLGYLLWEKSGRPGLVASEDFPSKPAVSNPNSSIRDKHNDPSRFGQSAMVRNNKFVVPKMLQKGLVTINSKWPLNQEEYNLAYSAKAYGIYAGAEGSINSMMRLKSPLFNGNDRRFNPAQTMRTPIKPFFQRVSNPLPEDNTDTITVRKPRKHNNKKDTIEEPNQVVDQST